MKGICHILSRGRHLLRCLTTGFWTMAPKAITGPKSRRISFGTTLWRHVQRYCGHFLLFVQIMCSGYSFLHKRKSQNGCICIRPLWNFFKITIFACFGMDAEFILVYNDIKISKNRPQLAEKLPSISRERVLKMGNLDLNANGENFAKFADCLPQIHKARK